MVQKIYSKMHPVSCTNTHHDITELVNQGMVKYTKTWIYRKWKVAFLRNEKILNLFLRWHILKSYRFVAQVISVNTICTAPKMKFSIKDFFRKRDQIHSLHFLGSVDSTWHYLHNCPNFINEWTTILENVYNLDIQTSS